MASGDPTTTVLPLIETEKPNWSPAAPSDAVNLADWSWPMTAEMADCSAPGRSAKVMERPALLALPSPVATDNRQRDSSCSRCKTRPRPRSDGFAREWEKNLIARCPFFYGLRYKGKSPRRADHPPERCQAGENFA